MRFRSMNWTRLTAQDEAPIQTGRFIFDQLLHYWVCDIPPLPFSSHNKTLLPFPMVVKLYSDHDVRKLIHINKFLAK